MEKIALKLPGGETIQEPEGFKFVNQNLGSIVTALLPYLFIIAGLLLLIYLIIGGFNLMTSGGDPKSTAAAKQKITHALIGFLIIFLSFWLIRILQVILGLPQIF